MNEKEIIAEYYRNFKEVSYEGTAGLGFNIIWKTMEHIYRKEHFENVLEIGSTHLEHLKYVRHTFDNYFATDLVHHEVNQDIKVIIKNLPPGRRVITEIADAMKLPYPDEFFDRTLTTCLFHHLSKPEIAMQEMLRVTKPGGVISFFLPYDPGVFFRFIRHLTTRRNARKLHALGTISEPKLIWALEHRNHIGGIRVLVREVFKEQDIRVRHLPPFVKSSNFGVCEFLDIQKVSGKRIEQ